MVMEGGGGFPDTVLKNIDKFADVDGDKLVSHLITNGHPYSVSNSWDTIPNFNKDKALELLIQGHYIPTDAERLKKLGGEYAVGKFINKLQDANYGSEFLKVVFEHAEPGSLNTKVAQTLLDGGYVHSVKYKQSLFDEDAQKLIASVENK